MYIEIYKLDPAKFISAPRLTCKPDLKKTTVKLELLNDMEIILIDEKEIRDGICHSLNRYAKTNNKYMKDYDKNKESSYLKNQDINNLYDQTVSQALPVNGFKWVEDLQEFNEDFIKSYNEKSNEGYFHELDIQYPENLHKPHNDLPFLLEIKKFVKVKKLKSSIKSSIKSRISFEKNNKVNTFN